VEFTMRNPAASFALALLLFQQQCESHEETRVRLNHEFAEADSSVMWHEKRLAEVADSLGYPSAAHAYAIANERVFLAQVESLRIARIERGLAERELILFRP
jgi:hypothetical protein